MLPCLGPEIRESHFRSTVLLTFGMAITALNLGYEIGLSAEVGDENPSNPHN